MAKNKSFSTKKPINTQKATHERIDFLVDEDRRKYIRRYLITSKKWLKLMDIGSIIMLISGLLLAVGYILVKLAVNSFAIGYVTGTAMESYTSIVLTGVLFLGMGSVFSVILKLLPKALSGQYIKDRTTERAELLGGYLRYTYTPKGLKNLMRVIEIPVNVQGVAPIEATYDPQTSLMIFKGKIRLVGVVDHKNNKKIESTMDELYLYDYFTPSVHQTLQRRGIKFNNEEMREDYNAWAIDE